MAISNISNDVLDMEDDEIAVVDVCHEYCELEKKIWSITYLAGMGRALGKTPFISFELMETLYLI